jgi:hypothetical protein
MTSRVLGSIALVLLAAATACKGKGVAAVEGVVLAQADLATEAPSDGALLVIDKDPPGPVTVPTDKRVRVAFHWGVSWKAASEVIRQLESAGREVVLLVGQRSHVMAFALSQPLEAPRPITVYATYTTGKACVQAPGAREAKCVQSADKKTLDRAGLRSTVREAVRKLGIYDVEVEVDPELPWGDVVRALDGARTCCFDEPVRARLTAASTAF